MKRKAGRRKDRWEKEWAEKCSQRKDGPVRVECCRTATTFCKTTGDCSCITGTASTNDSVLGNVNVRIVIISFSISG